MPEPFGFLIIDKPQGMTSHDVVAKIRRGSGVKRVGHAGTLDPMATGVLIVCVGAATRLSEYVMASNKQYMAVVRLGIETTTYDAEGETLATADVRHLTRDTVATALASFQGEIAQIPPMYSAIKQGGKKLYELARAGKEVVREPRTVRIERIDLLDFALPDVRIAVTCSAGTYIRSIAHDLGAQLGVGAHLIALRRTASGGFHDPVGWQPLIEALQNGDWQQYLIDERIALAHIPTLALDASQSIAIQQGRSIPRHESNPSSQTLCRAYNPDGQFIAILESDSNADTWRPHKVFNSTTGQP